MHATQPKPQETTDKGSPEFRKAHSAPQSQEDKHPDSVRALLKLVDADTAYQIIDALELEARRRVPVGFVGCIVFDAAYGEFVKMGVGPGPEKPPQKESNDDTDRATS